MANPAARGQSLVCLGASCAGRVRESAPAGNGQLQHSCGHGARLLLGTRVVTMVEAMSKSIGQTEVLVAGGGPAGLATAIAARQAGFEVAVVDCAQPPIDKACGEGIMPDGLTALAALGVHVDARQAAPFRGIRFINGTG